MASRGVDGVTIPSSQVPTQVGKTCGGTILGYLKKNGIAFHEVHLHKLDKETLARHKRVIISARDPVDRLVRAARTSNDGSRRARAAPSTHLHRRRSRRLTGAARKRAAIGHAQHSMLISSTVSSRCTSASTLVSRASSTRCTASIAYLGAGQSRRLRATCSPIRFSTASASARAANRILGRAFRGILARSSTIYCDGETTCGLYVPKIATATPRERCAGCEAMTSMSCGHVGPTKRSGSGT